VLAWKNLGEKRSTHVDAPKRIVPSRAPQWSEDGSTVYVGIARWPAKIEVKKSDEDPATVEVWHWQDVNVISEQKLTAARDRDRNAPAAWHLATDKLVPLSANVKEDVRLPRNGARALALDGVPYQNDAMFGRDFTDVYKITSTPALAPRCQTPHAAGRVQPWRPLRHEFQGRRFLDLRSGIGRRPQHHQGFENRFHQQENDYPVSQKPSYGVPAGPRTTTASSFTTRTTCGNLPRWRQTEASHRRQCGGSAPSLRPRDPRRGWRRRGGRGGGGAGAAEPIDLAKPCM